MSPSCAKPPEQRPPFPSSENRLCIGDWRRQGRVLGAGGQPPPGDISTLPPHEISRGVHATVNVKAGAFAIQESAMTAITTHRRNAHLLQGTAGFQPAPRASH